jgi:hypothetical protein
LQEVLDDDDAKLKYLWIEYGDDVCNAVKTALKATMKEVLKYLFRQMETTTKRRRG